MADRNTEVDDPKRLEAEARVVMWEMSRIDPNQWGHRGENAKARERLHREFDALVDRWAVSRLLEALARISE